MKIQIFTDIHGDFKQLKNNLSKEVDYNFILGDLTNNFREKQILEFLKTYKNVFVLPGNNEPSDFGLNFEIKEINSIKFLFVGGSPTTPFNTLNELTQEEYKEKLSKFYDLIDENTIILSHAPPYGILDRVGNINTGIVYLRKIIEDKQPKFVFCGHIHEYAGNIAFLKNTTIINPGKTGIILHL